jgi:hypothetical protein
VEIADNIEVLLSKVCKYDAFSPKNSVIVEGRVLTPDTHSTPPKNINTPHITGTQEARIHANFNRE